MKTKKNSSNTQEQATITPHTTPYDLFLNHPNKALQLGQALQRSTIHGVGCEHPLTETLAQATKHLTPEERDHLLRNLQKLLNTPQPP